MDGKHHRFLKICIIFFEHDMRRLGALIVVIICSRKDFLFEGYSHKI